MFLVGISFEECLLQNTVRLVCNFVLLMTCESYLHFHFVFINHSNPWDPVIETIFKNKNYFIIHNNTLKILLIKCFWSCFHLELQTNLYNNNNMDIYPSQKLSSLDDPKGLSKYKSYINLHI